MTHSAKPSRQGGTQLIVLSVLLVLLSGVALWYWLQPRTQPSLSEGQTVATTFLDKIRDGQPELAWESTTADFKSDQGKESFLRSLKTANALKQPLEFVSVQTVALQDLPRNEYIFRSQEGQTVRILIGREAGAWKVDRLTR